MSVVVPHCQVDMLEEKITNTGDRTHPQITEQQANSVFRLCEDQQLDDLTIESSFFHKCGFMLSVRWSWIGPHTAFSCFSTSPLLRNQPKTLRVVLVSVPPANCAPPSGVKVDMACGEHLLDHCQSLKDIKQIAGKEAIQVSAAERFRTKSEES